MSLTNAEVAHRWANDLFADVVRGSNCHGDEKNFYSYSTVIAQCLDREKELFIIIDKTLTLSTSKHIGNVISAMTTTAKVIKTHFKGAYYHYDNADFLSYRSKFDKPTRLDLVTHLLLKVYDDYLYMSEGKTLDAEHVNVQPLKDILMLNELYGDCSISKWLNNMTFKNCRRVFFDQKKYNKLRKMARMILENRFDDEICDAINGKGTWDALQKRIAPLKKAREKRLHFERVKKYLGYSVGYSWTRPACPFSNKELAKLTGKQIFEIKLKNLEEHNRIVRKYDFYKKYHAYDEKGRTYNNACKFIGINETKTSVTKNGREIYNPNMYDLLVDINGEKAFNFHNGEHWDNIDIHFDYKGFQNAADKKAWRERFWKMCELKQRRIRGSYLYGLAELYDAANLPLELSEEDNHIYNEFIVRRNKYNEYRERRQRIEDARKARELHEKIEKLDAYKNGGIEGVRRLWIEHIEGIPYDVRESPELCYGGNVLLRFSKQEGIIETSKGIRLPFADCHKYFAIIKAWHDGTQPFMNDVKMAGYKVVSFINDILTAGCHRIAYCEMERMYNELCERENAA